MLRAQWKTREIDRFLSELSAAWMPARDEKTLLRVTAEAVGRQLHVDHIFFSDVTPDASAATVEYVDTSEGPCRKGPFAPGDYLSESGRADLVAGRPVVVSDVTTDSRTGFASVKYLEIGICAFVSVPLRNDAGLQATLSVNTKSARIWLPDEVQLLEHVAARLWPAIERARAEDTLRQSEQRHGFLVRLFDALRPLSEPHEMQEVTARLLGEHLRVNRVNFADIEGTNYIVRISWAKDVAPLTGSGPAWLFGKGLSQPFRSGEPVSVNDVQTDPRLTKDESVNLLANHIASFAGVLLRKGGRWVSVLGVNNTLPREWTHAEVELIRDVAHHTWESIQRAQAELALREREQRLRLALDASGGGSWIWDATTNRLDWDDHFRTMYGFPAGQTPTVDAWPARVHEEDRPRLLALLAETLKSKTVESWDNVFRIVRPDGTVLWIQSRGHVDRDVHGNVTRLTGLELDITERRRDEEAILARRDEEHDRTLRMLLETATQGILSMDSAGKIVTANRALEEMFGWSPGELSGQSVELLLPPELRGRHIDHRTAYFLAPSPRTLGASLSLLGMRKDRSTFPIEISVNHVATQSGGHAIAFVTDISERKEAEEQLRRSHAELEDRTAELELRTAQLSRLASELTLAEQNTREQLARTLHDGLQQLLFSASLRLDRLSQRGALGTSESELLAQAQSNLDNAISASRSLSVELFPPALHGTGLPAAVTWLAEWMREKYGLEVQSSADPLANSERRDVRTLVFESLRELLFNAVKHAQVDRVTVELMVGEDDTLLVTVTDQGIGFDPATLFNRFNSQRTGMGLFSIRERLMLLGGRLEVESSPGQGTRFHLVAPRGTGKGSLSTSVSLEVETPGHPAHSLLNESPSRQLRILIVDDHTAVREGLRELLLDQPEFQIVGEASNGLQAIAQARALRPDAIVMDISMPEMDGIEATRRIHAELPFIQIFGLSAHERTENLLAIKRAGGTDYFIKGANMQRLVDCLLSIRPGTIEFRKTAI